MKTIFKNLKNKLDMCNDLVNMSEKLLTINDNNDNSRQSKLLTNGILDSVIQDIEIIKEKINEHH